MDLRSPPDLEARGPQTNCGKTIRPRAANRIKNESGNNNKRVGGRLVGTRAMGRSRQLSRGDRETFDLRGREVGDGKSWNVN